MARSFRTLAGCVLLAGPLAALAQVNALPVPEEEPPGLGPEAVARIFEQACILTEGVTGAAIDWALSQGFEPVDPMRPSEGLLDGKAGTVLVAPASEGRVMLAAAESQCSVWAERTPGPPVRLAMAALAGRLQGKGAKLQVVVNRNVERSGAWRNQAQWRYRSVGGSQDFGIGSVTTLTDSPGTQVLHLAPMPHTPNYAPDGTPLR
jgi:hypothetical protein